MAADSKQFKLSILLGYHGANRATRKNTELKQSFLGLKNTIRNVRAAFYDLRAAAMSMGIIGGAVTKGLAAIVNQAVDFESVMGRIKASTRLSDSHFMTPEGQKDFQNAMKESEQIIGDLSNKTIYYRKDVAETFLQLRKGGVGLGKEMKRILEATLLATQIDRSMAPKQFAEKFLYVRNVMESAGMKIDPVDLMAKISAVANRSATDITRMANAIGYLGPVLRGMKVDTDEFLAMIGTMSKLAVTGSKAGTLFRRVALKTGTSAALKGTKQLLALSGNQGMMSQFYEGGDPRNGLASITKRVHLLAFAVSAAAKKGKVLAAVNLMKNILGVRGQSITGLSELKKVLDDLTEHSKKYNRHGLRRGAKDAETTKERFEILKSKLITLAVVIGRVAIPFIEKFTAWMTKAADASEKFLPTLFGGKKGDIDKAVKENPLMKFWVGVKTGFLDAINTIKTYGGPIWKWLMGGDQGSKAEQIGKFIGKLAAYGPILLGLGVGLGVMALSLGVIFLSLSGISKLLHAGVFLGKLGIGIASLIGKGFSWAVLRGINWSEPGSLIAAKIIGRATAIGLTIGAAMYAAWWTAKRSKEAKEQAEKRAREIEERKRNLTKFVGGGKILSPTDYGNRFMAGDREGRSWTDIFNPAKVAERRNAAQGSFIMSTVTDAVLRKVGPEAVSKLFPEMYKLESQQDTWAIAIAKALASTNLQKLTTDSGAQHPLVQKMSDALLQNKLSIAALSSLVEKWKGFEFPAELIAKMDLDTGKLAILFNKYAGKQKRTEGNFEWVPGDE